MSALLLDGTHPLDVFWEHIIRGSLYKKWASANPREHAALAAYAKAPAGPPPVMVTETGRALVQAVLARGDLPPLTIPL